MKTMIELWKEGCTRFTNQLAKIKPEDLSKKLGDSPNSAGFLIWDLIRNFPVSPLPHRF